jgi:hypothetical protein
MLFLKTNLKIVAEYGKKIIEVAVNKKMTVI